MINGQASNDQSGFSVSSAGDLNADGLADLIVGARMPTRQEDDPGRSYVVFGRTDSTPIELSDVAAGTGGLVINGHAALNFSGISVSSAGDLNADGLDLIVGAHWADSPSRNKQGGVGDFRQHWDQ